MNDRFFSILKKLNVVLNESNKKNVRTFKQTAEFMLCKTNVKAC